MNFLTNMRISHKIIALMVGLIVGFIIIGVTYYIQIGIETDAREQEQSGLRFRSQLASINSRLINLINQGDAFVQNIERQNNESGNREAQSNDSGSFSQLQKDVTEVRQQLTNLRTETTQAKTLSDETRVIDDVINQFDLYQLLLQRYASANTATTPSQQTLHDRLNQQQRSLSEALISIDNKQFAYLVDQQNLNESTLAAIDRALANLDINENSKQEVLTLLNNYRDNLNNLNTLNVERQSLDSEFRDAKNQLANLVAAALAANYSTSLQNEESNTAQRQIVQAVVTAIIFAVAMGTAVGVYFLYKSIVFPMVHMQSVIGKINRGKTGTRVKVLSRDELGDLGKAFNQLLDERINQLEARSLENDQLNNSIISLIKALGMIAQKDLTVKVPVSPDITGTVSDAVNLLTTETAQTLEGVKLISEQVNAISEILQGQSNLVMQFADGEKRQIIATAKALEMLARAMNEVASHAETADTSAAKAIENTQLARHSVEETVNGIRTIRETISETEKRTKRLGDRSQEISGIVNLINTIAERTHILALNASMHAASAGEAGRGFAVVADEVQRLAESARQSTDEIAAMVNNMRVETSDTVAIMNTLISQVADGSRSAEEAGKRMTETENATQALVQDVKQIAKQAVQQAEVANRVRDRSAVIRKFTEKTGKQLEEQKLQTDNLKLLADNLVSQVNVFTLPAGDHRIINISAPKIGSDQQADNVRSLHAAS